MECRDAVISVSQGDFVVGSNPDALGLDHEMCELYYMALSRTVER